jgi:hypothetical protein
VELTTNAYGLTADISYVDFVGLPLGLDLALSGNTTSLSAQGLPSNAVSSICSDLTQQASIDHAPWDQLCVKPANTSQPLRALSPIDYISNDPGAFQGYSDSYVNSVWQRYSSSELTIAAPNSSGNATCQVTNDQLVCSGDNRPYGRPTAADIFGCNSGPFAIQSTDNDVHRAVVPKLCAAFNRGTLLLDPGNVQPTSQDLFYTGSSFNWYSKAVHQHEVDGKGYAFSYDDVAPAGGSDQAGLLVSPTPGVLTVTVGAPLNRKRRL